MAVVDAVQIPRNVIEPIPQPGGAQVQPAATCIKMEVVPRDARADVGVLEALHLLKRNELARRTPAAHIHITGILF
jgi:hypothetical protein